MALTLQRLDDRDVLIASCHKVLSQDNQFATMGVQVLRQRGTSGDVETFDELGYKDSTDSRTRHLVLVNLRPGPYPGTRVFDPTFGPGDCRLEKDIPLFPFDGYVEALLKLYKPGCTHLRLAVGATFRRFIECKDGKLVPGAW
jgi:hypothetical protein